MASLTPGQRCISAAELQLGLGTVLSADQRTVTVLFLSTGETRIYAKQTAPLTRVAFAAGDQVRSHEGWELTVARVVDTDGLLTYEGSDGNGQARSLPEAELDHHIQLNRPVDRLFSGQVDADKWFSLRHRTLQEMSRLRRFDLYGLLGGRTSLIPHQLYIAHEVARRHAPRVLLADEVGLGKTIEAGLVVHQQLLCGEAARVLIVVPDSLLHQWLVEMVRRFNLRFSIFDEERCAAIDESSGLENPFQAEQLVLCRLGFLTAHPERLEQALQAGWDLLVVDEAHHLAWSPESASTEYLCVERLAHTTRGVLLLTATPEQLGKAGHFARLRLLDPDRFHDYATFLEEEQHYQPVASLANQLLSGHPLDHAALTTLREILPDTDCRQIIAQLESGGETAAAESARRELVERLLDRHGTGRVLFRNTRTEVSGFPERRQHAYPLSLPVAYAEALRQFQSIGISEPQLLLCPELLYQATADETDADWTEFDPRIPWLQEQLKALRPAKVLLITASADTAMDLATALRLRAGIHAAVFHEGLSLLERDRAAAYFADQEYGSQVLICSEIGSEGRNFQFAHHLILFDLPYNPDLLEQRIGRLDRIGQRQTVQIHVPYLEGSGQAVMHRWYHEGLNAFEQTCPTGHAVYSQVRDTLLEALHQIDDGLEDLPALIATTRRLHDELSTALKQGRDRLLELNSCRPAAASELCDLAVEHDREAGLEAYLDHLYDCFGVDSEVHGQLSQVIRPGAASHPLGGLPPEGLTVTLDRETALANEDMQFLTWEHPLVAGAMESLLSSELGNTAVCTVRVPGIPAGSLLLETLFVLETAGGSTLSHRHLPPTSLRVLVNQQGKDLAGMITAASLDAIQQTVRTETARKIVKRCDKQLREMVVVADTVAQAQTTTLVARAREEVEHSLAAELDRLQALRAVNPNIRADEITHLEQQMQQLSHSLAHAGLRLDALRVIVLT